MDEALNAKRKKLDVYTLICQVSVAVSTLVFFNLFKEGSINLPMVLLLVVHVSILMLLHIVVVKLFSLYFTNKTFVILYAVLIFSGFFSSFLIVMPVGLSESLVLIIFSISLCMILVGMSIWFVVIVRDIFMEQHDLTYRILGAANIYWLMIVVFAYIFALFELSFPGSMGITVPKEELLGYTYKLSLHSTVSIDHPFHNMVGSLENLCLLQSAVSHLFIVFLVGRLLTK